MRAVALGIFAVVCVAMVGAAQQPQFKAGTELVIVDVVATDAAGQPVRNLTAADFELFEDGISRPIETFHAVDAEAATPRPSLPQGLVSNEGDPAGVFVVMLDEFGLEVTDVRELRRTVEHFLTKSLQPHDYVAVIRGATASGLLFSHDRQLALNALHAATGLRDRGLQLDGATLPDPGSDIFNPATRFRDVESVSGGRTGEKSFDLLIDVVEKLRLVSSHRKAVLWVSRGGDLAFRRTADLDTGSADGRADARFTRLIAAAHQANVAVYAIDPRGLVATSNGSGAPASDDLGTLRDIAAATGGRAIINTNDVTGALTRVVTENRSYYLLGYLPMDRADQRPRKLEVRTRRPGVSLLHRRAYAPTAKASATAAPPALASLLPIGDIPITLAPAAAVDARKRTGVVVPFAIGNSLSASQVVDYSLIALNTVGSEVARVRGTASPLDGTAHGMAHLLLPRGLYQLRLAAGIKGSDTRGLAMAAVQVPSGKADPPLCSGFVFDQRSPTARFRRYDRSAPLAITTLVSAKTLSRDGVAFGIGTTGQPPERAFPVTVGPAVADGLWQLTLTLTPPLPRGIADIVVLHRGAPLSDTCRTTLRFE